jgi:hypothetical protein
MKRGRIFPFSLAGITLFAASVLGAASPGAAQQSGSVEFTARIRPSSGIAEPARGLPFVLLRKSFVDIQKEADATEPKPVLNEYIDSLKQSPELKAWMKKTKTVKLSGEDLTHQMTPADIMKVPEFYDAYLEHNAGDKEIGFPQPKFRERDKIKNPEKYEKQVKEYRETVEKYLIANPKSASGIDVELMPIDPGPKWERMLAERVPTIRRRSLDWADSRYKAGSAETDLDGRAVFRNVPPGEYWISTLEVAAVAGDARLRWDTPVVVRAGEVTRIELSNSNAVEPPRISSESK